MPRAIKPNRLLKNVASAAKTRRARPKKRSLLEVNEHFSGLRNAGLASAVVFQQTVKLRQHPRLSLAVQYATEDKRVPSRSQLRRWICAALQRDATITLRIVNTTEGRILNRTYRKKDSATNVLTFVYHAAPDGVLLGDIVLCAPVVEKEAREQRKELMHHYAHLATHGTLHLQGYDHETDGDADRMERLETALLARLKIRNPYDA